jgi:methenyltetrahydrofolate cyclohydrolase
MSTLRETKLGTYLEAISSASPTPGGGSVAAVVAALGAALGSMVTALSAKKSEDGQITALAAKCSGYCETFLRLSAEDQSAFDAVMSALKLPKDDANRADQIEVTVQAAARAPLAVAQSCVELLSDLESLGTLASRHCISDVGAAAYLALAALRASLLNVHINMTFMKDQAAAVAFDASASELENEGTARCQRIVDQVIARIRG